jgi:small redox-active disulfide protein 2
VTTRANDTATQPGTEVEKMSTLRIEVYGPGCANCRKLEENTRAALEDLGVSAEIVKVEDLTSMAAAGVMRTPALAVDGRLILHGKIAPPRYIADRLRELAAADRD